MPAEEPKDGRPHDDNSGVDPPAADGRAGDPTPDPHAAPEPYQYASPEPYRYADPGPDRHAEPLPYLQAAPMPYRQAAPMPYRQAAPMPYSSPDGSGETADLRSATDPTLDGGFGWSVWRFNGDEWELVDDRSSPAGRAVTPDPPSRGFVGLMTRTASRPAERDDRMFRTDVSRDTDAFEDVLVRAAEYPGYCEPEELRWIVGTAAALRPGSTWVEVGSLCGRSLVAAGLAIAPGSTLVCVDSQMGLIHRRGVTLLDAYREIATSRPDLNVVLVRGRSTDAHLWRRPQSCDVVYLDGDHRGDAVRRDVRAWQSRVRPGGMLAGHDYGNPLYPGLTAAVDELSGSAVAVGQIWVWPL